MADIRIKGGNTRAALDDYLEDVAKANVPDEIDRDTFDLSERYAAEKEIAWLRKEVSELQDLLKAGHSPVRDRNEQRPMFRATLPIATTLAAAFVFGRLISEFWDSANEAPLQKTTRQRRSS